VALPSLYESGLSTYKLAAQFDVNPNTVRMALLAAGVQMRSRSGR
jgi:DNA-binding CsgD family transcriptional regulator